MKWTKLKADRFGPLRHWEGSIHEPFAVFYGKNEAGKSTMMELMCTLLFGAHKKKNETKKLITWGSSTSTIEGTLQRDDGTSIDIQRAIRIPGMKGSLQQHGSLTDIGDQPLSWLNPIDRELYRNIYALSLHDLLFPGQEAWSLTQDQLLSGTASQHRPASQVREELYRSFMAIWRPDRRGKTMMEDVDSRLRDLYDRLYQSQQDQHHKSNLEENIRRCQEQIAALRQQQQQLQEDLETSMALREKAILLEEGRGLLSQAGNIDTFDTLPENVEEVLQQLRNQQRELAQKVAESGQRLAHLSNAMENFTAREEKLLENAGEIERLYAQLPTLTEAVQQLPDLFRRSQEASQQASGFLDSEIRDLFNAQETGNFDPKAFKAAADAALNAHMELLQAHEQLTAARKKFRSPWPWITGSVGFVLFLASAALFLPLNLIPLNPDTGWIVCSIAAALGILGMATAAPLNHILKRRSTRQVREVLQQAQAQQTDAMNHLLEKAAPLSPRKDLQENANQFISLCQQYADLALTERELTERLHQLKNAIMLDHSQIQALSQDLLPEMTQDMLGNLKTLGEALKSAQYWQAETVDIDQRMIEERSRLTQLKLDQQHAVDREQDISDLLYQLEGADITQKMDLLNQRRKAASRGAALLAGADAQNIPQIQDLDAHIAEIQNKLNLVLNQLQETYNTQGAVTQRLEQFKQLPNVEDLENEIQIVTDQQAALTRKRDEEALLFALIKLSEQRFRDQHQPDVVRRASSYLSQITGGRYSRIVMSEDQQGIRIFSPDAGEFIDPTKNRLSQGTGEQVFLSLRLGLIDHLDPEGETLPLLLDETFVNWDHDRLVRGLAVLSQIASKRQMILFTCHPWMLQALDEAGCHYQLIDMES